MSSAPNQNWHIGSAPELLRDNGTGPVQTDSHFEWCITTLEREDWFSRRLLSGLPALRSGDLTIRTPRGGIYRLVGETPGASGEIRVLRPRGLARVFVAGACGLAQSYAAGDWQTPDLPALLETLARNESLLSARVRPSQCSRLFSSMLHALRRNSRIGSRRNIHAHYDLGNAFYSLWLDGGLSYSAACFDSPDCTLEEAQRLKHQRILEQLRPVPGQDILEIGCGWGQFAIDAARQSGCKVRAITISRAQHAYASARVQEMGLADRVRVDLCDYRDLHGQYDHIVSIEMFEAVGESYWPIFFDRLAACMKPQGRAVLQVINIDDAYFEQYRRRVDFIQRYIFPGGMLPSHEALRRQAEASGFSLRPCPVQARRFPTLDYAHTLSLWLRRFDLARNQVLNLGFDERFIRLWRFYLAYCEAGFRIGRLGVRQNLLTKQ